MYKRQLRRTTQTGARSIVDGYRSGLIPRADDLVSRAAAVGVRTVGRYPDHAADALHDAFFPFYQELKKGRVIIMGIVMIAPLVGLLGTVTGMIETFDSLGEMSLFSQSGGIAGGISQALFSTQMGLCVAIPGVVVGRILDRKQRQAEEKLDQIKVLLGGTL